MRHRCCCRSASITHGMLGSHRPLSGCARGCAWRWGTAPLPGFAGEERYQGGGCHQRTARRPTADNACPGHQIRKALSTLCVQVGLRLQRARGHDVASLAAVHLMGMHGTWGTFDTQSCLLIIALRSTHAAQHLERVRRLRFMQTKSAKGIPASITCCIISVLLHAHTCCNVATTTLWHHIRYAAHSVLIVVSGGM